MLEYKVGSTPHLPVRLVDAAGAPVVGVGFGAVTATVEKSDGSTQAVTVNGGTWVEVSAGAFSGLGVYTLILSAGNADTVGPLKYAVSTAGAQGYPGVVKIVANEEADTVALIGTPVALDGGAATLGSMLTKMADDNAGADFNATTDSLNKIAGTASPAAIADAVLDEVLSGHVGAGSVGQALTRIGALLEGKWEISQLGPDANRLILYAKDGITVIQKWDLFDSAGAPTSTSPVFARTPVSAIP